MSDSTPDNQPTRPPVPGPTAKTDRDLIGPTERTISDPLRDHDRTTSTAIASELERTHRDGSAAPATKRRLVITTPSVDQADSNHRFAVEYSLGRGATSEVWLAHDRDFDRDVAIKYLAPTGAAPTNEQRRFLREARVTAGLEHPNIVPVHDLGHSADGGLFMVMRSITGQSLGDRIRDAIEAGQTEIEPVNTVVNIFLKVCDAIAYAHSKNVLHRDIKPDNIMVGDFGEVVLVDWGTALDLAQEPDARSLVGTPAYMSPEQARGENIGPEGDIYCLGASLFHALYLRHPLHPVELHEEYWKLKCAGAIDPPTAAEAARVPRHLQAIILKAMAPDAKNRYHTVRDLASDLEKWQAGLAVTAFRDPWTVRLARWHRRRAWLLWPAAIVLLGAAATGSYLYQQHLKELSDWGRPILEEDFSKGDWKRRWSCTTPDAFTAVDGRLVSQNTRGANIFYNQRLTGSVAVEYDGEILKGAKPCDLSIIWCEGNVFATAQPQIDSKGGRTLNIQAGAYDNVAAVINASDPEGEHRESYQRLVLEPGRVYHFRVIIDGNHIEQQIDGQTYCVYDPIFPCTSGYIGLYAYYPGKAFSHLKIYNKGVAQKVSVLAIGDNLFQLGDYDRAATFYQRVVDSQPGTDVADAAVYRQGLSRLVTGHWDDASACWDRVTDPKLRLQIQIHQLDHFAALGQMDTLAGRFGPLYEANPDIQAELRNHWRDWVGKLDFDPPATLLPLLSIEDREFPDEADTNNNTWMMLSRLGRWKEVLNRFPQDHDLHGWALLSLGNTDAVLKDYQNDLIVHCTALVEAGDFDQAMATAPQYDWLYRPLLLATNRYDTYASEFGLADPRLCLSKGDVEGAAKAPVNVRDLEPFHAAALFALGKTDDAIAYARTTVATFRFDLTSRLQTWAGRDDDAIASAVEYESQVSALTGAAIAAAQAGRMDAVKTRLAAVNALPWSPYWAHGWFGFWVARPFLADYASATAIEGGEVSKALSDCTAHGRSTRYQQPAFFAKFVLGKCSEAEFRAQPCQAGIEGMVLLGKALQFELSHDGAHALAAYQAYEALPLWKRGVDGVFDVGDPLQERFVAWRMAVLTAGH